MRTHTITIKNRLETNPPAREFNHLRGTRRDHFDLCHPQDWQVCFDFNLRPDAPEGVCRSYSVAEERAPMERPCGWNGEDLILLVDELIAEASRAWYCSSLDGLKLLRQYLIDCYAQDEIDYRRYEVALAEYELPQMEAALAKRRDDLARDRRLLAEAEATPAVYEDTLSEVSA